MQSPAWKPGSQVAAAGVLLASGAIVADHCSSFAQSCRTTRHLALLPLQLKGFRKQLHHLRVRRQSKRCQIYQGSVSGPWGIRSVARLHVSMRRRSGDAKMVVGVTTAISACGTGIHPDRRSSSHARPQTEFRALHHRRKAAHHRTTETGRPQDGHPAVHLTSACSRSGSVTGAVIGRLGELVRFTLTPGWRPGNP